MMMLKMPSIFLLFAVTCLAASENNLPEKCKHNQSIPESVQYYLQECICNSNNITEGSRKCCGNETRDQNIKDYSTMTAALTNDKPFLCCVINDSVLYLCKDEQVTENRATGQTTGGKSNTTIQLFNTTENTLLEKMKNIVTIVKESFNRILIAVCIVGGLLLLILIMIPLISCRCRKNKEERRTKENELTEQKFSDKQCKNKTKGCDNMKNNTRKESTGNTECELVVISEKESSECSEEKSEKGTSESTEQQGEQPNSELSKLLADNENHEDTRAEDVF
ncbi:uncharacterized protein LOC122809625 [Protopterus annectens]|uniref:uncharacterized protein LOC122809625 n=1 Tax=Protopterus annectens TaxID=7888 RepID=UPI001CFAA7A8|nr:uncharacterized protein LOC122809625 [Protopterus annectens]